jgi:putative methionine-R-sulfoxide reductase with GAF domain
MIAETDGGVVGYAYAGPYRTRPAYRFTLEDSVYVHSDFVSRGYGQLLLDGLIGICIAKHSREMIAVIGDSANLASVRLHAKLGFREIGVLEGVGRKFGRWIDTVIMQRSLYRDERLSQIGRVLELNGSKTATLQQIAELLRHCLGVRWVGLYKVDHNVGEVRNLVFSGKAAPAHPVFSILNGLTGIAIRERRTVNIGDVNTNPHYLTAFGNTRSEIIVPVYEKGHDAVVGTIDAESENLDAFSEEDAIFLEDCAQEVSAVWSCR